MTRDIGSMYALWRQRATEDPDLSSELAGISGQEEEIRDRFYRDLAFGTGGLRGVIGAGTNRMNIYTVRRATQGLARYLNARGGGAAVAISFDSRIKSRLFAVEAAKALAANGIRAYLFDRLQPTPVLSFAVRELKAQAGIMVTASHNPAKYNGYKCYGPDGCQMTDRDAGEVTACIEALDMFADVKTMPEEAAREAGLLCRVPDDLLEKYTACVMAQRVHPEACAQAGLSVIYTPLNGTGNIPVRTVLARTGVSRLTVVPEQEMPNGEFPTAPYPNPEIRQAFERALALAESEPADLLLATDPDCDRVGIAVPNGEDYTLMTGNEVGCLLLDYLLRERRTAGTLPERPLAVKTIVTSGLASAIAKSYGCEMIEVLTGFKYIGEQIGLLEQKGEASRYVFGFEESYGYLAGSYVRDKDAVVASMLICEMTAFYKLQGKSLPDVLSELYATYGVYRHRLLNKAFEGEEGMIAMNAIMRRLREHRPAQIGGRAVVTFSDYLAGEALDAASGEKTAIHLPASDVLSFGLKGNAGLIIRPSGTEPKIKVYVTATGEDEAEADRAAEELLSAAEELLEPGTV